MAAVSSIQLFIVMLLFIGFERLLELWLSRRNAAWSFARGGREFGQGHFPLMVAAQLILLVGGPVEVVVLNRPFFPWLAAASLVGVIFCQALRYWVIATLGRQWNVRVIVIPNASRIARGPFRYLNHPNYVAVVLEGLAIPMFHSAYLTAVCFSLLNGVALLLRWRCENQALRLLSQPNA